MYCYITSVCEYEMSVLEKANGYIYTGMKHLY
jgi:hypothetical protein